MADIDSPLVLEPRTALGKGLGTIRHEGKVPAVVHNFGAESMHVMVPEREMIRVYKEAGKHHPLNLTVGDQQLLALIKDVHYNPVKRQMQHVVFQAIRQDEKVEAEIPVHIEGEIPAEKIGLVVLHQLDTIEVEALPKDLPDEIKIDGSLLAELHDKITVGQLSVPAGVTILTDAEQPVATVVETKAQMSEEAEEPAEGEEAETAEGEVSEGADAKAGNAKEGEQKEAGNDAPKE